MTARQVSIVESLGPLVYPPFAPPRWLRPAHIQTLVASRKPRTFLYGWDASEPIEIDLGPEGTLVAEASWQRGDPRKHPTLFLLHGLEGDARSHYLIGISKKAYAAGFNTVRVNTRNCGGTEHRTPTLYCAGLSQDVHAIVVTLRERLGMTDIYGAGVSLGANILLKYLGERGWAARDDLCAAAVLSPPVDLKSCAVRMEEPGNWLYQAYFVRRLKARLRRKLALFPKIADPERVDRVRTIYEFDDVVTAPHFGYGTADNYYRLASCGPLLQHIRVPTLIVQAKDDPLIPFESFLDCHIEANPYLRLLAPDHGGHLGFLGLRPASQSDRDAYWGECRVVQFLSSVENQRRQAK